MQLWGAEEGSDKGLERCPPATRKGFEANAEGPLGLETLSQSRCDPLGGDPLEQHSSEQAVDRGRQVMGTGALQQMEPWQRERDCSAENAKRLHTASRRVGSGPHQGGGLECEFLRGSPEGQGPGRQRQRAAEWVMAARGRGKAVSQISMEHGGWQVESWGQNRGGPQPDRRWQLTKECPQGKRGPGRAAEPASARGGGGASVSRKDTRGTYTGPQAWAGTEAMVSGRRRGSKRMREN